MFATILPSIIYICNPQAQERGSAAQEVYDTPTPAPVRQQQPPPPPQQQQQQQSQAAAVPQQLKENYESAGGSRFKSVFAAQDQAKANGGEMSPKERLKQFLLSKYARKYVKIDYIYIACMLCWLDLTNMYVC